MFSTFLAIKIENVNKICLHLFLLYSLNCDTSADPQLKPLYASPKIYKTSLSVLCISPDFDHDSW